MRHILILLFIVLTAGCTTQQDKHKEAETGRLRYELFVKCMELAAKMPRQSDDDVHNIISECGTQSFYQANHIMVDK